MFLARGRKQGRGKEKSEDALTNEGSHNALAQLSVCAVMRKDESAVGGRDRRARRIIRSRLRSQQEQEAEEEL